MLKTLWIMRHGLAENEFESDFERDLSSVGRSQAKNVALQLLNDPAGCPKNMLVSPFKRTQETATIVHQMLAMQQAFETEEMLVHFAEHKALGDFLLASDFQHLIIVSHMPIVANLCQYLVPNCDVFGFETAQIVRLDFDVNNNARVTNVYLPEV